MQAVPASQYAAHTPPPPPRSLWLGVGSALLVVAAVSCRQTTEPARPQPAAPPPQPAAVVSETWDAVFMGGTHVGSVHTQTTRTSDTEPPTVTIVSAAQLAISRFGNVATMRLVNQSVETGDGTVRSFSQRTESGASTLILEGRVEGERAYLTHHTAGKETTTELAWSGDQGGFFAVEESLRRAPLQPGETRTVSLLMPGLAGVQLATATLEAQQRETTRLLEGSRDLLRIKQTVRTESLSLDGFCWTDEQGEIIKSQLPDLQHETFRTSRERALATGDSHDFDLGFDTIVRVASPLPRPHATRQVIYEATLQRGNPAEVFASGTAQHVEPLDAQRARITVRALRPDLPTDGALEQPPTDAERLPNNLIQSDDQRVTQIANGVAAEATDPWQICLALEQWVHAGIEKKNFSQGFATAADVAQSLEGDCTEHAVLLAALCRARQIPARVCVGLVYSPGDQGFAFHMWNEVWITDRWIPLDATLGLGGIGGGHIKLRHSNLSADQAESAVMSVLQVMNQLALQIVDVQ